MEKKGPSINEDWLSLWIGLGVFALTLGVFAGIDFLGWGAKTEVWTDITKSVAPVSKSFAGLPAAASLMLTFVFMLAVIESSSPDMAAGNGHNGVFFARGNR